MWEEDAKYYFTLVKRLSLFFSQIFFFTSDAIISNLNITKQSNTFQSQPARQALFDTTPNRSRIPTSQSVPGTLAMQSRCEEHTGNDCSTSAGLLASITVTLLALWVLVQIHTSEERLWSRVSESVRICSCSWEYGEGWVGGY